MTGSMPDASRRALNRGGLAFPRICSSQSSGWSRPDGHRRPDDPQLPVPGLARRAVVRVAGKRTAGTAFSSGPVRGMAACARGSADPSASRAARSARRTAGTSGPTGAHLAVLAVPPAVSARRVKRKGAAVQCRGPAVAALRVRHGRATAAAAAATALANHHGQHDGAAVRAKWHGCGRDRGPGTAATASAATTIATSTATSTAGTRATTTPAARTGKRVGVSGRKLMRRIDAPGR
ncbi:MAG: hypothetical protein ACRDOI_28960 [Trebonia sp.]